MVWGCNGAGVNVETLSKRSIICMMLLLSKVNNDMEREY